MTARPVEAVESRAPRGVARAKIPAGLPNVQKTAARRLCQARAVPWALPFNCMCVGYPYLCGMRLCDLTVRPKSSGDLATVLQSRLSLPPKAFSITEAFPLGKILPQDPPSKRRIFLFRVLSVADAELIVRSRCALRSTQLVISDVLSPDERATHNALWPTFVEARRMGLKPQFNRARLFVSNNDKTTKYRVSL